MVAAKDADISKLRQELAEAKREIDDKALQLAKISKEHQAQAEQPKTASNSQNYYFESLMLQNDQIQLELRRIGELFNSQYKRSICESDLTASKVSLPPPIRDASTSNISPEESSRIVELYKQLNDQLKTSDYGQETFDQYFSQLPKVDQKVDFKRVLEACLRAMLDLFRVNEEATEATPEREDSPTNNSFKRERAIEMDA